MSARAATTELETIANPAWAPLVDTEVGRHTKHFILVPGLVPDGRETFLRQRHMFQSHGSITTLTYSRTGFDLDTVQRVIIERVREAAKAGEQPVLVGVSVGAGFIIDALRQLRDRGEELPLSGLVLVSPFTVTADLAPMLRRVIDPILSAGASEAKEAMERGRNLFMMLAQRSVTTNGHTGWRKGLSLLTPSGLRAWQERAILARIESTLTSITPEAALQRVTSLAKLKGITDCSRRALHHAPTLILWGSKERQTLTMEGPGTSVLCRPDFAFRVFPRVQIQWVYGDSGEEVPHASLLKHAYAFNVPLKRWLRLLDNGSAASRAITNA